jgi:uncharacterized membrane protein
MIKKIMRWFLSTVSLLTSFVAFSQEKANEGLDATMRSNGKIYVVVAVCLTILLGLFIYVFVLDRKISRLEKEA